MLKFFVPFIVLLVTAMVFQLVSDLYGVPDEISRQAGGGFGFLLALCTLPYVFDDSVK